MSSTSGRSRIRCTCTTCATVLKLMGVQHDALSVRHKGLDMRLTDLFGENDIAACLTGA